MLERLIIELEKIDFIKEVIGLVDNSYQSNYYLKILKCEIEVVNGIRVSLMICIPDNWGENLIDIYIEKYQSFVFIPHVEKDGKICLFEKEGILIDKNLIGITVQSLFKAKDILNDGILKVNTEDFINEFESYWMQLPNIRLVYFIKPNCDISQKMKYTFRTISKHKQEKQQDYLRRLRENVFYIAKDFQEFTRWKLGSTTISNVGFFVIDTDIFILPPDMRKPIIIDYLNELLHFVEKNIIDKIISDLGKNKVIIFQINQPNGRINHLGFFVEGGDLIESQGSLVFRNVKNLQPLFVNRADKQYLITRTAQKNLDYNKRILVIGCGSIGGYLINELTKMGFSDLTIVDDDYFSNENIFRHVLGMEYVSQKKCNALKKYINNNIPDVNIKAIDERIEDILLYDELDLNEFDIIFSTTGNHNINRWLNKFINDKEILTPIIYAWNEVYGIGCHVAYFKHDYQGCYDCLFSRDDETGELYDRSSYCQPGQNITLNIYGCDKTFVPYGNTTSIKTALICIDVVKEFLDKRIDENFILSLKGNDKYFKQQGLRVSKRYDNQKELFIKLVGHQLANSECEVCNGNNR